MSTAVGFSIHTGWAVAVGIVDAPPRLLDRARIELADDKHTRFIYHAARERPEDAARMLQAAGKVVRERAQQAFTQLQETCGRDLVWAVAPAKRTLPELKTILGSHPLIHAAEGEFYRQAIIDAGRALNLPVVALA